MMNPDRWQQQKSLFNEALKLNASAREEFLANACADDAALRHAVEELLASHAQAGDFIEQPAVAKMAGVILEGRELPAADQHAGQNEVTRMLGRDNGDTVSRASSGKHPFFWVILALGAFELSLFIFAGLMIYRYGTLATPMGWQADNRRDGSFITDVDPQGPAAGQLQIGDRILALNHDYRVSRIGVVLKQRSIAPQSPYTIAVRRGANEQQFTLVRPASQRTTQNLRYILSILGVNLIGCVLAVLIGVLRPEQRVAQVFALTGIFATQILIVRALDPIRIFFQGNELLGDYLANLTDPIQAALVYHFFYLFPSGLKKGRFWSGLNYVLYAGTGLFALCWAVIRLVRLRGDDARMSLTFHYSSLLVGLSNAQIIFVGIACLAACAVLVHNYYLAKGKDQRRRMKWVVAGLLAGLLPTAGVLAIGFIIIASEGSIGSKSAFGGSRFEIIWWLSMLAIGIIPLTLAYAILTRRVLALNIVVRRGVQYLLASNALRVVLALPVLGLIYAIVANRHLSLAVVLGRNPLLLLLIAAAGLGLIFRRQLSQGIDRRFFREAYNQEQILLRLIEEVKRKDSLSEIARLVAREISATLHPSLIHLLFCKHDGGDLEFGYSSAGEKPVTRLASDSRLIRFMEDHGGAQEFPFPPKNKLPLSEKEWLARLGVTLIVPLSGTGDNLSGLLLLGEKKSEEPYTATDRHLLEAIGSQIAIFCENIRLKQLVGRGEKVSLAPGAKPLGRYLVERLIGEGGMGKVYLARDSQLDRPVALKFLPAELAGDQKRIDRFFREARAASALNHPNIITVHEMGQAGDQPFIATEFVSGLTLRQRMVTGPIKLDEALAIAAQIGAALTAAHAASIAHRDIKPENVMIRLDGYVKVLDFGLAKLTRPAAGANLEAPTQHMSLTEAGLVMGTARYMSPEQARGLELDGRTDIWSLGVVIYEMLTGRLPFSGNTVTDTLAAILNAEPAPLRLAEADVPEGLQHLVSRALRKDVAERYQTIGELLRDLNQVKDELEVAAKSRRAGTRVGG